MKKTVLVSACLCGINSKYDGNNNYNPLIERLKEKYNIVMVCPEESGLLTTPRDPSEIVNDKVLSNKGVDVSYNFDLGAKKTLETFKLTDALFAVFKDGSPSCGVYRIYDGTFKHNKIKGQGITTRLLQKHNIKVYSEDDLETLVDLNVI